MEQSPSWETNSHSATQVIPHLLWNPEVHYGVHSSLPQEPILGQMYPIHNFKRSFHKIHFNIIVLTTPRSSEIFLFISGFPIKMLYAFLISHVLHAPPISSSSFDDPNNICWSV